MSQNRNTDYHDRLEQEVTSLRRDLILAESETTQAKYDLRQANHKCMALALENDRLTDQLDHVNKVKRQLMETNTELRQTAYDVQRSHAEIAGLRLDNEQLRQAIAVLNDEPTNSL